VTLVWLALGFYGLVAVLLIIGFCIAAGAKEPGTYRTSQGRKLMPPRSPAREKRGL
jgi:uncharacterized membrane protein